MKRQQEFIVFTGPMASGKTSSMLSALERFKYQSKKVFAFKPHVDARYSVDEIVTHNGLRWPATVVKSADEIMSYLMQDDKKPDVVAVDEAFMLPNIAETLIWLYKQGVTVLVSSIDISATGKLFPEVATMLGWATSVHKQSAVCVSCGSDAYYSHRKASVDEISEVLVGDLNMYEPLCIDCHPLIGNE